MSTLTASQPVPCGICPKAESFFPVTVMVSGPFTTLCATTPFCLPQRGFKAIFAHSEVERKLDPAGLSEIFTFWSPMTPRTAFQGIEELRPGHFAILENGRIESRPYWSISFPQSAAEESLSEEENAEFLRKHLPDASQLRFTGSDVPVGASVLPGGMDSSITSAIVSIIPKRLSRPFSIRFSEAEFREGKYQKKKLTPGGRKQGCLRIS